MAKNRYLSILVVTIIGTLALWAPVGTSAL